MNYPVSDIAEYKVVLVSEFAQHYGLTAKQAYQYIRRFGGIQLIEDNYGIMHTLTFEDVVESVATFCHRKGGLL